MIKCSEGCIPLCDFCKNFIEIDNSDDYYEDGICKATNEKVSRLDYCEDNFICFRVEEEE